MAAVSTTLALGAAGLAAAGSIKAGNSAKKQAQFQAAATKDTGMKNAAFIESESFASAAMTEEQALLQDQILRQQAEREKQIAKDEEDDYRREQSRVFAEMRAAAGGSGIRMDTGTPVLAAGDFASEVELNALRIRNAGKMTAERLAQEAEIAKRTGIKQASLIRQSGKAEADLMRSTTGTETSLINRAGKTAQTAGYFRAGASLLKGAANAYG